MFFLVFENILKFLWILLTPYKIYDLKQTREIMSVRKKKNWPSKNDNLIIFSVVFCFSLKTDFRFSKNFNFDYKTGRFGVISSFFSFPCLWCFDYSLAFLLSEWQMQFSVALFSSFCVTRKAKFFFSKTLSTLLFFQIKT